MFDLILSQRKNVEYDRSRITFQDAPLRPRPSRSFSVDLTAAAASNAALPDWARFPAQSGNIGQAR